MWQFRPGPALLPLVWARKVPLCNAPDAFLIMVVFKINLGSQSTWMSALTLFLEINEICLLLVCICWAVPTVFIDVRVFCLGPHEVLGVIPATYGIIPLLYLPEFLRFFFVESTAVIHR